MGTCRWGCTQRPHHAAGLGGWAEQQEALRADCKCWNHHAKAIKAVSHSFPHTPHQVARLGQLQVAHWELEQGLNGAASMRRHLTQLHKELLSGRTSIALVLVQVREDKQGGTSRGVTGYS